MVIIPNVVSLPESDIWAIVGACLLICLDVLVGFIGAIIRNDFQSTVMREGLGHKLMELLVIALGVVLQILAEHITEIPSFPSIVAICAYIIVMEVGSVWENAVKVNPELADTPLGSVIPGYGKDDDFDES